MVTFAISDIILAVVQLMVCKEYFKAEVCIIESTCTWRSNILDTWVSIVQEPVSGRISYIAQAVISINNKGQISRIKQRSIIRPSIISIQSAIIEITSIIIQTILILNLLMLVNIKHVNLGFI